MELLDIGGRGWLLKVAEGDQKQLPVQSHAPPGHAFVVLEIRREMGDLSQIHVMPHECVQHECLINKSLA